MSQLHVLINSLSTTELSKIKKIRIIGKEREVFDIIFDFRNRTLSSIVDICEKLNITQTHFYKINSILLDKLYASLIPEKGTKLLHYLVGKGLYNQFKHEAMMQEKSLLAKSNNRQSLNELYFNCFKLSQKVSARDLDENAIELYGKKYIKTKEKEHPDDAYYVELCLYCAFFYSIKATKKEVQKSENLFTKLQKIEGKLENSDNILAKNQLFKAYYIYHQHVKSNPILAKSYVVKSIDIIKKNQSHFSKGEKLLAECKLADILYMNSEFQASFDLYHNIINNNSTEFEHEYYHHSKYAQLGMLLEKYGIVKDIIEKQFGVYLESKQGPQALMGYILLAKLFLFTDFTQANKYVQQAKKLISKAHFSQYEFEIRILETLYFIFIGDMKTSQNLLKKNLKFMNAKGLNIKNSEMIYVFVLLQSVLKSNFVSKGLNNRLKVKLDLLQKSYAAVYGKLIMKSIQLRLTNE